MNRRRAGLTCPGCLRKLEENQKRWPGRQGLGLREQWWPTARTCVVPCLGFGGEWLSPSEMYLGLALVRYAYAEVTDLETLLLKEGFIIHGSQAQG